ncbi:RNA-binding protein 7-like [Artemia franciscana]|uniref:RRM domain-containing protein n=1 Tax=Artemia franciscana TaxID=6661 RepID=A0AA88HA99_ARTSF|nr:hypothetical protein QYM36_015464 [Artemia franciscana]
MDEDSRTLFVASLPEQVTEDLLYELLLQAGPVEKVTIPKDKDGKQKNFAFVQFKHEESVLYSVELFLTTTLFGKKIIMKPRESRGQNSLSTPNKSFTQDARNEHLNQIENERLHAGYSFPGHHINYSQGGFFPSPIRGAINVQTTLTGSHSSPSFMPRFPNESGARIPFGRNDFYELNSHGDHQNGGMFHRHPESNRGPIYNDDRYRERDRYRHEEKNRGYGHSNYGYSEHGHRYEENARDQIHNDKRYYERDMRHQFSDNSHPDQNHRNGESRYETERRDRGRYNQHEERARNVNHGMRRPEQFAGSGRHTERPRW